MALWGSAVDSARATCSPSGRARCISILAAALVAASAGSALAVVRYVDDSAPPGGNGQSWGTAYNNLRTALTASAAGDEIRVAQGLYKPGTLRTDTFTLKDGVSVRGGFAGLGTLNPNARDPLAFPTILSGDLLGNDGPNFANMTDNAYVVVTAPSTVSASTVLDGFTITGGNADGAFGTQDRGGGLAIAGSPAILNCTITRNSASGGGGVNVASTGNPSLRHCRFIANRATGASAGFSSGGGLNILGNAEVSACFFAGNSAAGNGGGLAGATGATGTKISNGVFTGNSAAQGGGVHVGNSSLINCTIAGNSASIAGGGLSAAPATTPSITNTILCGNTVGFSPQQVSGSAVITFSCVEGGASGTGNIAGDPMFVSPLGPDNLPGTGDEDLRLRAGPGAYSSCIDAGNRIPAEAMLTVDAAGGARFVDIPAVPDTGAGTGVAVDIGAYEAVVAQCNVDVNGDGFVDPDDLADFIAAYFGGCP